MRRSDVVAHAPALPVREVLRRFWPDARPTAAGCRSASC